MGRLFFFAFHALCPPSENQLCFLVLVAPEQSIYLEGVLIYFIFFQTVSRSR